MPYIIDSNGNYVPLPTITGEDGKEVTLRVSGDYIQWKREDTDWTNLVPVFDLQGEPGKVVRLNADGYILQYKYDGDAVWTELCDLSDYFGNTAAATAAAAANTAAARANAAAEACEDMQIGVISAHANNHKTGGSDPITPTDIGAATNYHNHNGVYANAVHSHTMNDIEVATSTTWTNSSAPFVQTITVNGITASSQIWVGLSENITAAQFNAAQKGQILCTGQGDNTITITAYGIKPTIAIPLLIRVI